MLFVKLDGAGTARLEGTASSLRLDDVLHLVPPLIGHVLRHQRVLGLYDRELARHVARTGSESIIGY